MHEPTRPQCCQVDAQLIDQVLPAVGELVVPVVEAADGPGGQQPVAELDAAASGQVVVTRPRLEQRAGRAVLVQRAHRSRRRDLGDRLEHRGHLGVDDLVVPMSAVDSDPDQAGLGQSAQVHRGGGGLDTGPPSQLPGRQRPPAGQSREHRRSGGIFDQVGD
jgi:hypothetical protein